MRVKNYENNKLNGLVKPGTGVDILVNSAREDIVNLMKRAAVVFVVVPMLWVTVTPRWS
jgi:hypothetical protein